MCQMIYFPDRDESARSVGELTEVPGGRPACHESTDGGLSRGVMVITTLRRKRRKAVTHDQ